MNNEHDQKMRDILTSTNTIASVGLSSNQEKESFWIVLYLKEQGYRIIPVNPTQTEIMGEKCYPSLSDIPDKVDVVQVFRKPEGWMKPLRSAQRLFGCRRELSITKPRKRLKKQACKLSWMPVCVLHIVG